jgi:hypothetical protein
VSDDLSISVNIPPKSLISGRGREVARAVVDEEIKGAMEASLAAVQGEIVPRTPVGATAILRGGTRTSVTGSGIETTGRVFNPVAHAHPVNDGATYPNRQPPTAALELWVRRKLGVAAEEARGVAFVIARAIKRRGGRAQPFFKNGFAAARPKVHALFNRGLRRIATRLGRI